MRTTPTPTQSLHRSSRARGSRRGSRAVALLGSTALLAGSLLTALGTPAQARAAEWQPGKHDEDTVIDCITSAPGTGVSADVGWRTADGQVPDIGERFHIRVYAGLVSLPCSGKVAVLPELMVPAGVEYADDAQHPVTWSLGPAGEPQQFRTDGLAYDRGGNGGILVGTADHEPFTLRQGQLLEIRIPVRATRVLKGPATQQPECRSRREGTAPCPIDQAGDHLQVALTVGGHGGDKQYVTPYVGLFAQQPGSGGEQPVVKTASRTSATVAASATRPGTARVTVTSNGRVPTGTVVAKLGSRVLGKARLTTAQRGRVTVRLPKLPRGRHTLTVSYLGSSTVKASSTTRTVRVR